MSPTGSQPRYDETLEAASTRRHTRQPDRRGLQLRSSVGRPAGCHNPHRRQGLHAWTQSQSDPARPDQHLAARRQLRSPPPPGIRLNRRLPHTSLRLNALDHLEPLQQGLWPAGRQGLTQAADAKLRAAGMV